MRPGTLRGPGTNVRLSRPQQERICAALRRVRAAEEHGLDDEVERLFDGPDEYAALLSQAIERASATTTTS